MVMNLRFWTQRRPTDERLLAAYQDGQTAAALAYDEQVTALRDIIAQLREQVQLVEGQAAESAARADAAADVLIEKMGLAAISTVERNRVHDEEMARIHSTTQMLTASDPLDPVPFGNEEGRYASAKDAAEALFTEQ